MRSGNRVGSTQRKLLQDILLERGAGNGYGRKDRQSDPYPFAVEEEEQLVMDDRSAQTSTEMVYGGARLAIARGGVGEVIGCVEDRAVP